MMLFAKNGRGLSGSLGLLVRFFFLPGPLG